jgi:hypothetical protein
MLRYLPAILTLGAVTLLAHHNVDATFDKAKETTYKATVTRTSWTNPHVLIFANVSDDAGKVAEWAFEVGAPNAMKRTGWTQDNFRVGEVLTIRAFPAKDGSAKANTHRITFADGRSIDNNDQWMPIPAK